MMTEASCLPSRWFLVETASTGMAKRAPGRPQLTEFKLPYDAARHCLAGDPNGVQPGEIAEPLLLKERDSVSCIVR